MCCTCLQWKANSFYSKKQLDFYVHKKATGNDVNGFTAKLRCRQCTGGIPAEIQCQSPYGLSKPLTDFSKAARSAGGSNVRTDYLPSLLSNLMAYLHIYNFVSNVLNGSYLAKLAWFLLLLRWQMLVLMRCPRMYRPPVVSPPRSLLVMMHFMTSRLAMSTNMMILNIL